MHAQWQDKEAQKRIVAIEKLLHRFGCRTKAQELELHQQLDEVHIRSDGLAKDLHDLQHYALTQLASYFTRLESSEGQVKQNVASTLQASKKVKVLVKLVAQLEREYRKADFQEFKIRLDAEAEKIRDNHEYWNVLDTQLGDLDQELMNARPQLLHKIQELDVKVKQEKELLDKNSGQVEEMQGQVSNLQVGQSKLIRVLNTIQDNVGSLHQGEDSANEEEGTLAIEPTIPITQTGESNEISGLKMEGYSEEVQQKLREIQRGYEEFITHMNTPVNPISRPNPLFPLIIAIITSKPIYFHPLVSGPVISKMRAPPIEPLHRERTVASAMLIETISKSNARPVGTLPVQMVSNSGDLGRPFILKNIEAPRNIFGKDQLATTTWLTEISCQIRLLKVPETDLWDVVATRMIGGALTQINAKLYAAEQLAYVAGLCNGSQGLFQASVEGRERQRSNPEVDPDWECAQLYLLLPGVEK